MHTIYDMIFCYQKKKHTSYVGFLLWALIIATKKPANFMINISIRDQYARSFTSAKSWSNIAFQGCIKHNMDRLQISLLILSKFKQINQLLFPLKSSENHRAIKPVNSLKFSQYYKTNDICGRPLKQFFSEKQFFRTCLPGIIWQSTQNKKFQQKAEILASSQVILSDIYICD